MAMAKIEYLLSEEGRKKSLLAGGDGKRRQTIEIEATPEIIELGRVGYEGNILLRIGFLYEDGTGSVPISKKVVKRYVAPGWEWDTETKTVEFDAPQTPETLIAWEKARRARLAQAEEDCKEEIAKLERIFEEEKRRQEEEQKARIEKERRRKEEEEASSKAREAEKIAWVQEHGSDYLKRAIKLGYNCQRQYVLERVAKELPGYVVDFDGDLDYQKRTCPSPEALDEVEALIEKGYDAEVVWITRYISSDDENDWPEEWEPQEGIVIHSYLGKYEAVKLM